MIRLMLVGKRIYDKFSEDEMTVYAAQVSFFVILSFVPFLMLLLTAVQMIPGISKADFLEITMDIIPSDYKITGFSYGQRLNAKIPGYDDLCNCHNCPVVCRTRHVQRCKRLKQGQWRRKETLVCV